MADNNNILQFLQESLSSQCEIRKGRIADKAFLFELYAANNSEGLDQLDISPERQHQYLMSQFNIQYQQYRSEFRQGEMYVFHRERALMGRLYLEQTQDDIYLIDLSLFPAFQNQDLGSLCVQHLKTWATQHQVPIVAEIEHFSEAIDFFTQHDFGNMGVEGHYDLLEWQP